MLRYARHDRYTDFHRYWRAEGRRDTQRKINNSATNFQRGARLVYCPVNRLDHTGDPAKRGLRRAILVSLL